MNNYKKRAALFLTSQGITLFGSSLTQFAMIWYVTMQTSSGVWVSAMTVAAYLPQFLITFFLGVWAARYSRKKMIILSDALIAVAKLLLAEKGFSRTLIRGGKAVNPGRQADARFVSLANKQIPASPPDVI